MCGWSLAQLVAEHLRPAPVVRDRPCHRIPVPRAQVRTLQGQPPAFFRFPQLFLPLLLLDRFPDPVHEQRQLQDVGGVVVRLLVRHAHHRDDAPAAEYRHGQELVKSGVACGTASFQGVIGLEVIQNNRPALAHRLAPDPRFVQLVAGLRVVDGAFLHHALGPGVENEFPPPLVVPVEVADPAPRQLDRLVQGKIKECLGGRALVL